MESIIVILSKSVFLTSNILELHDLNIWEGGRNKSGFCDLKNKDKSISYVNPVR